jgi:hypothetical protein
MHLNGKFSPLKFVLQTGLIMHDSKEKNLSTGLWHHDIPKVKLMCARSREQRDFNVRNILCTKDNGFTNVVTTLF